MKFLIYFNFLFLECNINSEPHLDHWSQSFILSKFLATPLRPYGQKFIFVETPVLFWDFAKVATSLEMWTLHSYEILAPIFTFLFLVDVSNYSFNINNSINSKYQNFAKVRLAQLNFDTHNFVIEMMDGSEHS